MAKAQTTLPVVLSNPRWAKDYSVPGRLAHFPAKLDPTQFVDRDAVKVTLTANAGTTSTTLSITAIVFTGGATRIPAGTTLYFGGAKVAVTTAEYTGGTSISVASTPTAMVIGDSATYLPFGTRLSLDSGTLVGRTYAERDANTGFGPAAYTDDEFYLLMFDVVNANNNNDCTLYRNGFTVAENFLPGWTAGVNISGNANLLATLRAKYICIKGVN